MNILGDVSSHLLFYETWVENILILMQYILIAGLFLPLSARSSHPCPSSLLMRHHLKIMMSSMPKSWMTRRLSTALFQPISIQPYSIGPPPVLFFGNMFLLELCFHPINNILWP